MNDFIAQAITSFAATFGFGIIFHIPRKMLIQCGFIGMLGWLAYWLIVYFHMDEVLATLVGAFLVALISQIFARWYKTPVIVFSVAGIIPLVPGGMAYNAMRNFVENDYYEAVSLAAKAFLISGSIAMGLLFSEVINQLIIRANRKKAYSKG
ncbi:threonine/serine exporter family protein [Bacillus sp. B1-b2]|uniref:threonine/serine exporter family protein n=1 Tax=Bacillus sp. B1-b2 TaxID=2653201 RepID=UPI00126176C6|nr:threonine/serine exporter family protein [Bacillus sp. B1-b2]KAB7670649.1 threonine/serine exporter [Bacillus sp. B1-b2]